MLIGGDDPRHTPFIFTGFSDAKNASAKAWQFYGTLCNAWPTICKLQRQGYGIFVCINASQNGRRAKVDIIQGRAVWGDFDGPVRGVFPIGPSLIIETTPGKLHTYWLFAEAGALSLDECEQTNRAIVARHDADPAAVDRSRVLRLAGTYHLKGDPCLVRIVSETGELFDRQTLLEAFPTSATPPRKTIVIKIEHSDRYIAAAINGERKRLADAMSGARNQTLNRAAFSLGQLGLSADEIGALLGPVALGTGLSRTEAWQTIKSGASAGARQPRAIGEMA